MAMFERARGSKARIPRLGWLPNHYSGIGRETAWKFDSRQGMITTLAEKLQ
jgi:hypothetical protein